MKDGFVKVACATPKIRVADVSYNVKEICRLMDEAADQHAKIVVFPELCVTGYTCEDLFWQRTLLNAARDGLLQIAEHSEGMDGIFFVGLPMMHGGKLYNVAAVLSGGKILGVVPKKYIPSYGEFYEGRHFAPGNDSCELERIGDVQVLFGVRQLFVCAELPELVVGAEVCEDLWVADPPSTAHALAGATVIVNLSASDETVTKSEYRELLVNSQSARLLCGYAFCSAGEGESTTDLVFGGHNLISENGVLLAQTSCFEGQMAISDIDVYRLEAERRRINTFVTDAKDYIMTSFSLRMEETPLVRSFSSAPFVPGDMDSRSRRCRNIVSIQAMGLKKRLEHTGCRHAVIGISGGLDSTLALLVTAQAFDYLKLPRENIICVTMPCFGTTDRTYRNACDLTAKLGASLREVSIMEAVNVHFRDIHHDPAKHDVTYENSQARERTQVLMDISNQVNGLVIGTGDMSELALGWATYNGDHMSMYGVNASVPKTLVRHLVQYYADTATEEQLKEVLLDVLNTPVSPELLPPENGTISQKTEDIVGPYELHDFFLYYMLRLGFSPSKILRLAQCAFGMQYDRAVILKWMKIFYRRFFAQQFKRSCLPDGPKVGSVAVSPRGDLRMPSDASAAIWLDEIEAL